MKLLEVHFCGIADDVASPVVGLIPLDTLTSAPVREFPPRARGADIRFMG
jgi:hypothetical protein